MTTKRVGNAATIYRARASNHQNAADPRGIIGPTYRGSRLQCLAGEIERLKRLVDGY